MHRSPSSEQIYRELLEGDPTKPTEEITNSQSQSLTLHFPDGDKESFYYPYLMRMRLSLSADVNSLILYFTSARVILSGYKLEKLHSQFIIQRPSNIEIYADRYFEANPNGKPFVIAASIEEKK